MNLLGVEYILHSASRLGYSIYFGPTVVLQSFWFKYILYIHTAIQGPRANFHVWWAGVTRVYGFKFGSNSVPAEQRPEASYILEVPVLRNNRR